MTVIAWDGKTLAADKAATSVGFSNTVTKIYRVPAGLVGFAGNGDAAMQLLRWFREGMKPEDWPECQKGDSRADAIFINKDAQVFGFGSSPWPQRNENVQNAMGSGRDYALAAMHLGYDSRRAVEVAIALDNDCGCGIDTLEI